MHQVSSNYSILPSKNLLYHLYHTILHHSQYPNFYFPILLIKIIYLHNKIYIFPFLFFSQFSPPTRIHLPDFSLLFTFFQTPPHTPPLLISSQAPSTSSTTPQLPNHHHRTSTMPTTPPRHHCPPKSLWNKNLDTVDQPRSQQKKKTQTPPPLLPLDQRFLHRWSTEITPIGKNHSITTRGGKKKKNPDQPLSKPRHHCHCCC